MSDLVPMNSGILLYQTEDGKTRVDVRFTGTDAWLSQRDIAELYQTTPQNITLHIRNIYADGEYNPEATCKDYLQVQLEGDREVSRTIAYYNLDIIMAVGYRVRSHRGNQFRRWATEQLQEYLKKGFILDDYRFKEGKSFGREYFDELLERIRDIRSSERMFYRKITEIYSLSVDYDSKAPITQEFYATVQNKLHFAVHGKTAAELIYTRADANQPNMGLSTWKGSKIRKTDVSVAKNYLNEDELTELNRIVAMYLDYAEDQAKRQRLMHMKDWKEKLDAFLTFNQREILDNPGKVSHEVAVKLAHDQFDRYRAIQIDAEDHTEEQNKSLEDLSAKSAVIKRSVRRK